MSNFKAENALNSISAGAPPHTPLGCYSTPPDTVAGFKEPTSKGRERREGKG